MEAEGGVGDNKKRRKKRRFGGVQAERSAWTAGEHSEAAK